MAARKPADQLVTPVFEGHVLDRFQLGFTGNVELDPTNAGDLALIEDLKLGRRVRFVLEVDVDEGGAKPNRDAGGFIKTVTGKRKAHVRKVVSHAVKAEGERAPGVDDRSLDEAIPPAPSTRKARDAGATLAPVPDPPAEEGDS